MTPVAIPITGEADADRLLQDEPLALLLGMLLDQQVPMEWAFRGPHTLQERLGRPLDAADIAAMDPEELERVFREKPALHRYPASMAKRAHALCATIVDEYDGDAAAVWTEATDGADALNRLRALPGYGPEKSKILLAILGKRLGVALEGWEHAAEPFSGSTPRSVADVDSAESLEKVRAWKKAQKAKGKKKSE
ncbi:MAG: HhH-GPD-type base excision DNA repair protein [Acidimicrobiia bacterium]